MKAGFVSASLSSSAAGIFEVSRSLALHLRDLRVEITARGAIDERWEEDSQLWGDIDCHVRKHLGPRFFGYVPGLVDDLIESDSDLLHLQQLWMYPSVALHRWHERTGKPYLVTAHGMLEPWALSNSRWKKRLAALLYENRMLNAAACLQANTEKEAADFRAYGLKNPICVIPNGVALPRVTGQEHAERVDGVKRSQSLVRGQETENRISDFRDFSVSDFQPNAPRVLLFLGRLHPKKGLVNALRAWKEVAGNGENLKSGNAESWQFVIAGWDQGGHGEELKLLCKELGLSFSERTASELLTKNQELRTKNGERVAFAGPVFGETKDALFRRADAFILPSFSEGLPIAVLEAWAYGLPVLMTDHCNLPEGFREGAALRIGTDAASIATGMRELFQGSCQDLKTMGAIGRTLVEERFTWPKVAAQMKEVYEWVVGGGNRPSSVE